MHNLEKNMNIMYVNIGGKTDRQHDKWRDNTTDRQSMTDRPDQQHNRQTYRHACSQASREADIQTDEKLNRNNCPNFL